MTSRFTLHALALATSLALAACSTSRSELAEHIAHWQALMDEKVPKGTPVNDAIIWGARNNAPFRYTDDHEAIYAFLERAPERGIGNVICSHWSILVTIHLAPDGTTTGNEVRTVGTCL